jgi:hypothetical protein
LNHLQQIIAVVHEKDGLHNEAAAKIDAHKVNEEIFMRPQPHFAALNFVHNDSFSWPDDASGHLFLGMAKVGSRRAKRNGTNG